MDLIQLLKSYLVSPPAHQSTLSLETDICPICRDNLFGELITLRCNSSHIFHSQCIQKWARRNPTCPFDRRPIQTEDLIPPLSTFNQIRFYATQFIEGVLGGIVVFINLRSRGFAFALVRIFAPVISATAARWVIDEFRLYPQNGNMRTIFRVMELLISILIDSEMMSTIGFNKVYTYFALTYLARTIKFVLMQILTQANTGYNYQLVAATRKSSVKSLGFMVGSVLLGYRVQSKLLVLLAKIVSLLHRYKTSLPRLYYKICAV